VKTAHIPITVIGGYLGAGKTTLLNQLLRNNTGLRIAVVVNDFGDINIDADLIKSTDGETIALANGCICCTLVDGLATVLTDLRARADSIDHVVIEASGVSDPVKIGQYGEAFGFALQGVLVVADAEQVRERAVDKYVGDTVRHHLQGADLLVLNKTDLLGPTEVESVRQWLIDLVPGARIVDARNGDVAVPVLLGPLHALGAHGDDEGPGLPVSGHAHFDSWSFACDEPLDRSAVAELLAQLPEDVLRAKGFVWLTDDADCPYLLQLVGRRCTLVPLESSERNRFETRLVLIGLPGSIDGERYDHILRGTAREDPTD
jgi:G3E family GTPase